MIQSISTLQLTIEPPGAIGCCTNGWKRECWCPDQRSTEHQVKDNTRHKGEAGINA